MFHQTILFLFKTLHTTPRRHISLTKLLFCHLLNNFFATISALCNNMPGHCKSKIQLSFMFFASIHTLQETSQETHAFFIMFKRSCTLVVIGWFWSMLFISFRSNYIRQLTFLNVLLFSCNPIGQLCWQPTWSISDLNHLRYYI